MPSPTIHKVALLGADGKVGSAVLHALVAHGFAVTVLKRQSSKSPSTYPSQKTISDAFEVDELAQALHGIDAVVVTIKGSEIELQKRMADAAVRAGVKRFIPADFGSVDSSSALTQALVPLYTHKTRLREYLVQLAAQHPTFSWTAIVCGHFFDWSFEFLHIDLASRRAEMLDDGAALWSSSTLARTGEATARVLERPEVARNRMVYVQSFLVSQKEVVAALKRATGVEWEVVRYEAERYREEERRKAEAGDAQAVENLVWLLGTLDANWEGKEDFAMRELGLENEDLDAVVRKTVEMMEGR